MSSATPSPTPAPPASEGPPPKRSALEEAVDRVLRALEAGEVVTYGEVAEEAGYPGRARAVGTILARSDGAYPWWRVVTATGRLVPGHEADQARRLRAEGVQVRGRGSARRVRRAG